LLGRLPLVEIAVGIAFLWLSGGAVALMELGRRAGRRRVAQLGEGVLDGFGAVEGAVFALLGLLMAFTFSAAASRFEARRDLIVREANAIGTAYLRLDVLPAAAQPRLRRLFGQYVDARLAVYQRIDQLQRPVDATAHVAAIQAEIWNETVAACRASDAPQTMVVVLPAMNDMFDITTTRAVALRTHLPVLVLVLLVLLILVCAALAGYGMARVPARSVGHMIAFAAILTVTVYVILDYEFPRFGLINVDALDSLITDLRKNMP
jgi:hypothetical protein